MQLKRLVIIVIVGILMPQLEARAQVSEASARAAVRSESLPNPKDARIASGELHLEKIEQAETVRARLKSERASRDPDEKAHAYAKAEKKSAANAEKKTNATMDLCFVQPELKRCKK